MHKFILVCLALALSACASPPSGASGRASVGEDRPPTPIKTPPPRYPFEARRDGITGTVRVQFGVAADGTPFDVVVVESPSEILSRASVEAVKTWRFKPGLKDGVPVNVRNTVISIPFELTSGGGPAR